ncbi:MAG: hypothetical protein MUF34_05300 [Polyangiaceae bacterium]|jgi:hypothetical protein|nr:hypothetical protein [Polyangiaceae bacterium]
MVDRRAGWLVAMLVASAGVTGCCGKLLNKDKDAKVTPVPTADPNKPKVGETGQTVRIPEAKAQFESPAGWTNYNDKGWLKFRAMDGQAMLGVVMFNKAGEATDRIEQMADQFDLRNIKWDGGQTPGKVGEFNAQKAGGTCKMRSGVDGKIYYATVDTGNANKLLWVYLYNVAGPNAAQHLQHINKATGTLRRLF